METKTNILEDQHQINQLSQLILSTKIGLFTLLRGRKWIIYILIAIFPILISMISQDYLFGRSDAEAAFIFIYIDTFYIFLFTFGVMLISLPVSADEISDNVIDLYLIRPIKRDTYWASRWIVINVGIFIINAGIVTFYWIYFHLVDNGLDGISTAISNILWNEIDTFLKMLVLIFIATFTYSGIFQLVGSIGNRGFTLGILLAITETLLISLLFLQGSGYIPRTHLNQFAYNLFKDELFDLDSDFSTLYGVTYILIFGILNFLLGIIYFRRRQFN